MAKTKDRLFDATGSARPYVERALTDDDVRDNVKNAFAAARDVYNELVGGRGAIALGTRVATDKDLQDNLRTAVEELRSAAERIQGKDDHKGRNSTLLIAGIALGILFNPMTGAATRSWLKERVLGGGDEFTYEGGGNNTGGGAAA